MDTTTSPADADRRPRIVLVPGFWLGAWAWDAVADALRAAGRDVTALTLPGLEPGDDPASVGMSDHVDAIVTAIGEGPVVLVAHSGAAFPASAAIDRAPARIAHAVWVDTAPVVDGAAMDAAFDGDALSLDSAWDEEFAQGSMRDLSDEQLATFRERAVPEPAAAVRESVSLRNDARLDVPSTLVCTAFTAEEYRAYADEGVSFLAGLPEQRALRLVDLPTGHWPMWSRPAELAALIDGVG